MITTNPIELSGDWIKGFALELHAAGSSLLGNDSYEHHRFDAGRNNLWQLLYRLKFKSDKSVLNEISNTAANFLCNTWQIANILDLIITVPPSNLNRSFQPVAELAERISHIIDVPIFTDVLVKTRNTPELKVVEDLEKRVDLMNGVFDIKTNAIKGRNILLFDDIYRSGATLQSATRILYGKGKVNKIYVLTLIRIIRVC